MQTRLDYLRPLTMNASTKIVLWVLDGLGGLPREPGGLTELESADTPHLDRLATEGVTGLHNPVAPGITPGSGAGHLGLFGYDPLTFNVGRGVLSAAGIDFNLRPGDVAARGNFCTVDGDGKVTDRRAGRIDTDTNRRLCDRLRNARLEGADVLIEPIKEHRFLLVLRGSSFSARINDTDPQDTGVAPHEPTARSAEAEATAAVLAEFIAQARDLLQDEPRANMILLRGFAEKPDWPSFEDAFGLRAAAAAGYPMYRGVARLLGMEVLPPVESMPQRIDQVRSQFEAYDFFFLHLKDTDSRGEDGDFDRKRQAIEHADEVVPELRALDPDVIIVTGDHSTPSALRAHSWHPVPVVLWSRHARPDQVTEFGERACIQGGLGPSFPATDLMPLALAHAGRLAKFGA